MGEEKKPQEQKKPELSAKELEEAKKLKDVAEILELTPEEAKQATEHSTYYNEAVEALERKARDKKVIAKEKQRKSSEQAVIRLTKHIKCMKRKSVKNDDGTWTRWSEPYESITTMLVTKEQAKELLKDKRYSNAKE